MIQTESQAKRFFIDAILSQASREGLTLSDNERWMLRFSESDPEFEVDPDRMAAFEAEISDKDYEAKITGLIRRAYEHDVKQDSDARSSYREAQKSLSRGDHYLLVMVDRALATRPARGVAKAGLFVILIPATGLAMMIAAGLGFIVITGQVHSLQEAAPFLGGFLLFASMSWYLIRLMIRESRS